MMRWHLSITRKENTRTRIALSAISTGPGFHSSVVASRDCIKGQRTAHIAIIIQRSPRDEARVRPLDVTRSSCRQTYSTTCCFRKARRSLRAPKIHAYYCLFASCTTNSEEHSFLVTRSEGSQVQSSKWIRNVHVIGRYCFTTPSSLIQDVVRNDVIWRDSIDHQANYHEGRCNCASLAGLRIEITEKGAATHSFQPKVIKDLHRSWVA